MLTTRLRLDRIASSTRNAALAPDVEARQGGDDPFLEAPHVAADISAAAIQIQQHIGDALARAVIGVLAAAAAPVDRQAIRVEQVLGERAGAGGVSPHCACERQ